MKYKIVKESKDPESGSRLIKELKLYEVSAMDLKVKEIMANELEAREVLQQLEHLQQENEKLKEDLIYYRDIKPNAAEIWEQERRELAAKQKGSGSNEIK
jgi:hypothetical protein